MCWCWNKRREPTHYNRSHREKRKSHKHYKKVLDSKVQRFRSSNVSRTLSRSWFMTWRHWKAVHYKAYTRALPSHAKAITSLWCLTIRDSEESRKQGEVKGVRSSNGICHPDDRWIWVHHSGEWHNDLTVVKSSPTGCILRLFASYLVYL